MRPEYIAHLGPCKEAQEWLRKNPGTLAQQWKKCPRGDWMLWLACQLGVNKKQIVLASCACARLVLHLIPAGEDRPRKVIEAAEGWCAGKVCKATVIKAATDAADAAEAAAEAAEAANAAAAEAAEAAADAAYAAYAAYAADAAYAAAAAAADAAYAEAAYAAADAACAKMRRKCAIQVAKHISWKDIASNLGDI